ncbi:hypothetical protein SG34_014595 [Thalassomonas viridans]|uniref:TfuA-like core domain-containing protein n=1 Tax=Thalassomonas viridans TaxID=137584 RepID=A0AAF0CBU1_9GAMM|nr:TfuA-like protein [Thalassomonas viridans]WDE08008.1 hypothetical protein SG34_014595 [Thalassomonas viridans]
MSIIIFTGPTISPGQAGKWLTADYRPPAKQGDIYKASLEKPQIIVLIDGFFEKVPAVWHKEILFAMSQGIHVFGCSSMGALRAAELSLYGMVGMGEVYRQFNEGILEDDDEVTIIHTPQELNYQALSDAMVNIRATLAAACEQKLINREEKSALIELAKQTWYPRRTFKALLAQADFLPEARHRDLSQYIEHHTVNVKQNDAILLLKHLAANAGPGRLTGKKVDYVLSHTDAWEMLIQHEKQARVEQQVSFDMQDLHNELKLGGRFTELKTQALTRKIAIEKAQKHQQQVSQEQMQANLLAVSRQLDCIDNDQVNFAKLSQWFESQQLDLSQFDRLMQQQSQLSWLESTHDNVDQELLDILRLKSELALYNRRITDKKNKLQATPYTGDLSELGIRAEELWHWYFTFCLNREQPGDLMSFAKANGFKDIDELQQLVVQEYLYISLMKNNKIKG